MPDHRNENPREPRANWLLRELQRWHLPRRPWRHAPRWLVWFDNRVERLRRMAVRCGSPAMVLAHPLVWVQRLQERWFVRTLSLRPQINLAIQPVLREISWRERSLRPSAESVVHDPRSKRLGDVSRRSGTPEFVVTQADARGLISEERNPYWDDSQRDGSRRRCASSGALGVSPVSLVFRRAAPNGDSWLSHHRSELVTQRVNMLFDRIVRTSQRTEDRTTGPTLIAARPSSKIEPTQSNPAPMTVEAGDNIGVAAAHARSKQSPAQSPGINVEALADQVLQRIDHRVTAWRERTGRR